MIRLQFYPEYIGDNEYIELFYGALADCGVAARDGLVVRHQYLRDRAGELDVIHFQWCPERTWRGDEAPRLRHLRNVVGLWRYLRLARRLGVRVVWTVHEVVHHDHRRTHFVDGCGYRVLARAADLVVCHSAGVRDEVVGRYGARPDRTVVMPIGNYDGVYPAPNPRGATLARLGLDPGLRTLACFGMVRPYKGFDVAVDALRGLGPGYQMVVAGLPLPDTYGGELAARAGGLNNLRLVFERVDRQYLCDLLTAADAVLLPYRQITGSAALLTALTLGRGVVASDLPFFRDVLAGEPDAGVLCRPGDAADLGRAVGEFFSRPAADRHAAARRLADRYAWGRVIRPVADWFRETFPDRAGVPVGAT